MGRWVDASLLKASFAMFGPLVLLQNAIGADLV